MSERGDVPFNPSELRTKDRVIAQNDPFLEAILDKPLTVERIDNYASEAVDDLAFLISQKVGDYQSTHNTGGWDDKSIEDAAMRYYGLESIGTYLDFLADKDCEIRNLDNVINKAILEKKIIIPPDKPDSYPIMETGSGNGMEKKKIINRTKTVLFILKEDFDVDVDNEEQLSLYDGVVQNNMMRRTSYMLIKAPMIERTILVCDEEGNASYVLNNEVLKKHNISDETLVGFTKTDLNTLITETPELGKRVTYSKDGFVPRMIDAIKHPESTQPDEVTDKMKDTDKYLYPKPNEGELSCSGLANKWGNINNTTLSNIITTIPPEELGEVVKRKFGGILTDAYTPQQQEIIRKYVEQKNLFASKANEDELSCTGLANKWGVNSNNLNNIIETIPPEELGEVVKRKFGGVLTDAYTPEQQEIIRKYAEREISFAPKSKTDELSCNGLANKLGIAYATLSNIIETIPPEELGEVIKRKFGPQSTEAYTLEQQEIIRKYVEQENLFAPKANEDELSCSGLANKWGVNSNTLSNIIETIPSEELGEVVKRKFNRVPHDAYTPEQQEIIRKYAERENLLAPKANEDELSSTGLANKWEINKATLSSIIETIPPEELGEVVIKRFGPQSTEAYTPEQQEIIRKYVEQKNLFAPKANEDELSCTGLANKWETDFKTLSKIIKGIPPEELGEVVIKKFSGIPVEAYTPEQQEIIRKYAEQKNLLVPKANEDELSSTGLANKWEINLESLSKIIKGIPTEELGEVVIKKFGSQSVEAYTPEQQEIIRKYAEQKNLFAPKANEDELSCTGLANKWEIDFRTLSKIIKGIPTEELGEVVIRKFGGKPNEAYTPEQQEIIKKYFEEWKNKRK